MKYRLQNWSIHWCSNLRSSICYSFIQSIYYRTPVLRSCSLTLQSRLLVQEEALFYLGGGDILDNINKFHKRQQDSQLEYNRLKFTLSGHCLHRSWLKFIVTNVAFSPSLQHLYVLLVIWSWSGLPNAATTSGSDNDLHRYMLNMSEWRWTVYTCNREC